MKRCLIIAVMALCSVSNAFAYFCEGQLDFVALTPSGIVVFGSAEAGLPSSYYVCQIGATHNGIGPEQCKAIFSLLSAATATGQKVLWGFNDALSCSTHPANQLLTGWYFGPQVARQ